MPGPADQGHDCPGCQTPGVPRNALACPECWRRLPHPFRSAVLSAFRNRQRNPRAHSAALDMALRWYRAHPAEDTTR